ncbi:MAG: YhbY family RNA-binding protein [Xanthomonadales bacterium]|nr:YhbY family RNA-binding protein [Gammaproteobacteria bacterium]MBT8053333.1 YhbY family RNA-binding protein [Gammaproteobacteria bacterium]NND58045.1 YhbY family RNA-binding protein [Xanthomonadales bacterium]NNK52142.1 YhbY family RNA-binding protein [Xanthomonadales bacterium]
MTLSNRQLRYLRGLTHNLKPVVMVADKGLSETVKAEIETALDHHELIKVKLRGDRETRSAWAQEIIAQFGAEPVHIIGQVACFFRRNPKKPVIELPRASNK